MTQILDGMKNLLQVATVHDAMEKKAIEYMAQFKAYKEKCQLLKVKMKIKCHALEYTL